MGVLVTDTPSADTEFGVCAFFTIAGVRSVLSAIEKAHATDAARCMGSY